MRRALLLGLTLAGCGRALGGADGGSCGNDAFDRACQQQSDCAALNHQLDCCGSQVVLGVARRSLSTSQQLEDACAQNFPQCRCATRGPVAEDGKEVLDGASLRLRCVSGRCETFVMP